MSLYGHLPVGDLQHQQIVIALPGDQRSAIDATTEGLQVHHHPGGKAVGQDLTVLDVFALHQYDEYLRLLQLDMQLVATKGQRGEGLGIVREQLADVSHSPSGYDSRQLLQHVAALGPLQRQPEAVQRHHVYVAVCDLQQAASQHLPSVIHGNCKFRLLDHILQHILGQGNLLLPADGRQGREEVRILARHVGAVARTPYGEYKATVHRNFDVALRQSAHNFIEQLTRHYAAPRLGDMGFHSGDDGDALIRAGQYHFIHIGLHQYAFQNLVGGASGKRLCNNLKRFCQRIG